MNNNYFPIIILDFHFIEMIVVINQEYVALANFITHNSLLIYQCVKQCGQVSGEVLAGVLAQWAAGEACGAGVDRVGRLCFPVLVSEDYFLLHPVGVAGGYGCAGVEGGYYAGGVALRITDAEDGVAGREIFEELAGYVAFVVRTFFGEEEE